MFCTKCGTKLDDNAAFCHNCGVSVEAQAKAADNENAADAQFAGTEDAAHYVDSDVRVLIGEEKESYYLAKFADLKKKDKKASWNWCAFLFGPAWMIYRKMYVYGAIYWAASLLLSDLLDPFDLVINILVGVFANWIYMNHLEKLALQAKAMTEPVKSQFIEKNKGTSWAAFGISMLCMFVVTFVATLLFGGIF